MKRLFFKVIKPSLVKVLDYVASYKSRWADGGIPADIIEKKYHEGFIKDLIARGYLLEKDEAGITTGNHMQTQKVYSLTPKSHDIARSNDRKENNKGGVNHHNWFRWIMSVIGATLAGLLVVWITGAWL